MYAEQLEDIIQLAQELIAMKEYFSLPPQFFTCLQALITDKNFRVSLLKQQFLATVRDQASVCSPDQLIEILDLCDELLQQ